MNAPQGWPQQPQQGRPQQPQMPPGPGYPHQGHPQQQGYPPPGHPQQPRKKGPIVAVVIIAVIVLLGGLGTGGFFFFNVRKDQGEPLRADPQPEFCKNVSADTLAKVRTTNPRQSGSFEQKASSTLTSCSWDQTEGRDGSGMRILTVLTEQTEDYGEKAFELRVQSAGTSTAAAKKEISGVGDQAVVVVNSRSGGYQELTWVVRKGDDVVGVEYTGWDPGLFSRSHPDVAEQEAAAKAVIDEVLGKL